MRLLIAFSLIVGIVSAQRSGTWDVCGTSNLYATDYQICCGDRIYQNLRGDIDCCNGVAYNKTVNYCFNNVEVRPVIAALPAPTPAPAAYYGSLPRVPPLMPSVTAAPVIATGGLMGAKPTSGFRCGSATIDSSVALTKTTLCCGNVPFDARYQLCSDYGPAPIQAAGIQGAMTVSSPEKYYTCGLDQVPSSAVTSYDTAFCCGTVVYDSRFYTCTRNNAVVPQVPYGSITPQQQPQQENRPRPSAYPPVSDGFTRVRCLTNLFDVPTNHMTYYSCCGSQAFDERYFVCTSTGSGTPRAQPINQQNQQPTPIIGGGSVVVNQPQPAVQPSAPQPQTSTQLQCGKRIYLFGPPTYGTYMQCCGDDVFDVRSDTCISGTKVSGGAQVGNKK